MPPRLSIVIPTHNRAHILPRTLGSLARQTAPPEAYEVILVADGCQDETATVVQSLDLPYSLRFIEQPPLGLSTARNRGAAEATAPTLLFFDDDMEALPGLVAAHIAAHEVHPDGVVLGYFPLPEPADGDSNAFLSRAKQWWDEGFTERAKSDHRYSFQDLCGGHVSLPRPLFHDVDGFETRFRGSGEDYELGARLLKRRVRFRFVREAASIHHDRPSQERVFRRAVQDGFAHAILASKHPELFRELKLRHLSRFSTHPLCRLPWRLAWRRPRVAGLAFSALRLPLFLSRTCGLTGSMFRFIRILDGYYYWSGVQSALGSRAAWDQLEQSVPDGPTEPTEIDIDVATDLPRLDEILSETPADAVRLRFHKDVIGRIAPVAGAESLRPVHVRAELIRNHGKTLLGLLLLDRLEQGRTDLPGPFEAEPSPSFDMKIATGGEQELHGHSPGGATVPTLPAGPST